MPSINSLRTARTELAENQKEKILTSNVVSIFSDKTSNVLSLKNKLDDYIFDLGLFLGGFSSNLANHISIGVNGNLSVTTDSDEMLAGFNGVKYKPQIEKYFLSSFISSSNMELKNITKNDSNVLDVKTIFGILVVTFDSSLGMPQIFKNEKGAERGFFKIPKSDRPGMIGIDISSEKRKDNVEPTVTLLHELRHFVTFLGDFIIANDKKQGFNYAIRDTNEYGKFRSKREMIMADKSLIESLTDIKADDNPSVFCEIYVDELAYLNELHSSFVQGKFEWLNPSSRIYIPGKIGNHYEITNHSALVKNYQSSLLGNLQKIHCLRYALSEKIIDFKHAQKHNQIILPENIDLRIKQMTDAIRDVISTTGAIIGTSRSIKQANFLVNKYWNEYIQLVLPDYIRDAEHFKDKYFKK